MEELRWANGRRGLFDPPKGGTVDPDDAVMAPEMMSQMKKKAKDLFFGRRDDT